MECGNCGAEMDDGRAEVHGTTGGFMIFGWSYQHLFWYSADRDTRRRQRLIGSGRSRKAWACYDCGLLTISVGGEASKATRGRG